MVRDRLRLYDRGVLVVLRMPREVGYVIYRSGRGIGAAIANARATYTDSAFTPSGRSVVI